MLCFASAAELSVQQACSHTSIASSRLVLRAGTDRAIQSDAHGHLAFAWLITCCKHAVCKMQITGQTAACRWSVFGSSPFQEVQSAQAPAVGVASPRDSLEQNHLWHLSRPVCYCLMVASVCPALRSYQKGVAMSSELQSSRVFLLCPASALLDLHRSHRNLQRLMSCANNI